MRERRAAKEKAAGGDAPSKPQEPPPTLYPDLFWVWSVFCYLSDRRGVGPNGPAPITIEAMESYLNLTNRRQRVYVDQVLNFVPILDREWLRHFYDEQSKEMEKARKSAERGSKGSPRKGLNRR